MIEKIKELVRIESVTGASPEGAFPYGRSVNEALEYVLGLCREFGFRTKNCSHRLGYAEIGEGQQLIGILCHLDVVPAGRDWSVPPFDGRELDGKLYGRGVIDDKGPAIAAIYAMKELLDSGCALEKRVRILFGLQEECGDWEDIQFYKETEELPHMGFTPDSKFPAIYCEKGIAQFRLSMPLARAGFQDISGGEAVNMVPDFAECTLREPDGQLLHFAASGVSAHGSRPEEGTNAISLIMEKAARSTDCYCAHWYTQHIGHEFYGQHLGCELSDVSGQLTLNVGRIYTEGDMLHMLMDVRHPVTFEASEVFQRLCSSTEPAGWQVSLISAEAPVYMERNGSVISALMDAYQSVTGDLDSQPQIIGGGTYARAMNNIVAFGPVFPHRERMEHKADEYAFIEDLYKAKDIYREGLLNLLSI